MRHSLSSIPYLALSQALVISDSETEPIARFNIMHATWTGVLMKSFVDLKVCLLLIHCLNNDDH